MSAEVWKSGSAPMPLAEPLSRVLEEFAAAGEELLASRALQRRVDTKYLLPLSAVPKLLCALRFTHRIVKTGDIAAPVYETLYWDTEDLEMFHAHRRGQRPRHKMRVRHHTDRGMTYLEVKRKGGDNQTVKARLEREFGDITLNPGESFVQENGPSLGSAPRPILWTNFRRITLVGIDENERLTIDLSLVFDSGGHHRELGPVAICEVKQRRHLRRSASRMTLRRLGVRPRPMSKYCTGICLLFPEVRQGAFRTQLRAVRKMAKGEPNA